MNIAVMASGRGSNFKAILNSIQEGRIKNAVINILITDNPSAYAIDIAKENNIEFLIVQSKDYLTRYEYNKAIAEEFKKRSVDLIVLAGYMKLVGKALIDAFPNKIMNIHPALLPSFPGAHGHRDAIDYGVKVSGCTIHFVDEGMDTGPIIIQAPVMVTQDDTEDSLSSKILMLEHKYYSEAVRLFVEGKLDIVGRKVIINEKN